MKPKLVLALKNLTIAFGMEVLILLGKIPRVGSPKSEGPLCGVVSMGRRNTGGKSLFW